jgi:hypothetical protein
MRPHWARMFRGPLARDLENFVEYRRDLSTYNDHLLVALRNLDSFLGEHAPEAGTLTRPLVEAWMATLPGGPPVLRIPGSSQSA